MYGSSTDSSRNNWRRRRRVNSDVKVKGLLAACGQRTNWRQRSLETGVALGVRCSLCCMWYWGGVFTTIAGLPLVCLIAKQKSKNPKEGSWLKTQYEDTAPFYRKEGGLKSSRNREIVFKWKSKLLLTVKHVKLFECKQMAVTRKRWEPEGQELEVHQQMSVIWDLPSCFSCPKW